jgi:hypothetical protein
VYSTDWHTATMAKSSRAAGSNQYRTRVAVVSVSPAHPPDQLAGLRQQQADAQQQFKKQQPAEKQHLKYLREPREEKLALPRQINTDSRRLAKADRQPAVICGRLWETSCQALVGPPSWSHGQHPTVWDQQTKALDLDCPPGLLGWLAQSRNTSVRRGVAGNPSSPPGLLGQLTSDPDPWVRQGVAGNPSSPPGLLGQLTSDPNPQVRQGVAWNPSSPAGLLGQLTSDPDPWVRQGVAGNPSSPPGLLGQLTSDPDPRVRQGVAGNPSSPPGLLRQLLLDESTDVSKTAADNPALPRYVRAMWQLAHSTA